MPDDRPLHEVLFDYAVYVPIGIAAAVAEQLPELTEKGKRLAGTRIHLARLMGEFAVGHAQRRVGRILSSNGVSRGRPDNGTPPAAGPPSRHGPESVTEAGTRSQASSEGVAVPFVGQTEERAASVNSTRPAPRPQRRPRRTSGPAATDPVAGPVMPAAQAAGPLVESLAIPAYDTLAASQVVQRLSSLEPDELEAVRRYELGNRGRRTILSRVAQLNAGSGRTTA